MDDIGRPAAHVVDGEHVPCLDGRVPVDDQPVIRHRGTDLIQPQARVGHDDCRLSPFREGHGVDVFQDIVLDGQAAVIHIGKLFVGVLDAFHISPGDLGEHVHIPVGDGASFRDPDRQHVVPLAVRDVAVKEPAL